MGSPKNIDMSTIMLFLCRLLSKIWSLKIILLMIFCNMPFSVAVCVYPTEKFSILSNEGEDRIKKEFLIKFPRMLYVYDGS